MSCSRAHQQMFHLVCSGIGTSNLSVTGPTPLTARLPAIGCQHTWGIHRLNTWLCKKFCSHCFVFSGLNRCNHGRGPLGTMSVCCQRCTHTLSLHPMGNRADHFQNPTASSPWFSRAGRHTHTPVSTRTTQDLVSRPRTQGRTKVNV